MKHTLLFCLLLALPLPQTAKAQLLAGIHQGESAELSLSGHATKINLSYAITGQSAEIEDWKERNQKAREEGAELPSKLTVATLQVGYADGRKLAVNLRYNESIGAALRDWWNPADGFIFHLAFAKVVTAEPLSPDSLQYQVSYRLEWPNPLPDSPIESVRIESAAGLGDAQIQITGASLSNDRVSGRYYFVAPDGSDETAGTLDEPWATLQYAARTIDAGDTVFVRGGDYLEDSRILFKYLDAPQGQRTMILGYPGEDAVFDFSRAFWDESKDRVQYGFEPFPHDVAMITAYDCDRFTFKNLHLRNSRSRGFSMESGFKPWARRDYLKNGGKPEKVSEKPFVASEILYCSVYKTFSAGIRYNFVRDGRLIGNTLMRTQHIGMGPGDPDNLGSGKLAGENAQTFYSSSGKKRRNPPMEGIDAGGFNGGEVAYNEVAWPDKECFLIDTDSHDLRVHHNFIHNAHNLPWAGGIAPNGYGRQVDIEIDHNIAHDVGTAFGAGAEGGGTVSRVRIHHNLAWDCFWNPLGVSGAWKDADARVSDVHIYNNTVWRNGFLDSNQGPAGGIAISFPPAVGSYFRGQRKKLEHSSLENILIANNVILRPRDLALAYRSDQEEDLAESRIRFSNNWTDLKAPSDIFEMERNGRWTAVHDTDGLIIVEEEILRDPENRDFRPRPGAPIIDGGLTITEDDILPEAGSYYAGAFGPGAKWVEIPETNE